VRRGDAEEHPAAEGGAVGIEAAVPGFQAEARAGRGAGLTFVSEAVSDRSRRRPSSWPSSPGAFPSASSAAPSSLAASVFAGLSRGSFCRLDQIISSRPPAFPLNYKKGSSLTKPIDRDGFASIWDQAPILLAVTRGDWLATLQPEADSAVCARRDPFPGVGATRGLRSRQPAALVADKAAPHLNQVATTKTDSHSFRLWIMKSVSH
jgi:hypothetical protein